MAKHKKQIMMLKGAEREPKPIGDHKEKQMVAIMATVGGATNIDMKFAKSRPFSVCEVCELLFPPTIEFTSFLTIL